MILVECHDMKGKKINAQKTNGWIYGSDNAKRGRTEKYKAVEGKGEVGRVKKKKEKSTSEAQWVLYVCVSTVSGRSPEDCSCQE